MPDGRRAYQPLFRWQGKVARHTGAAPARQHSVMSVYVRGMGWVDIRPWRPK